VVALGRPDLDLLDEASIAASIEAVRPDLIVNAAAYTAVDQAEGDEAAAFALNADGAGRLATAAARHGVPIIHLSTDYVFDGSKEGAYNERDPVAPLGAYGRSKLAGEQAVASANPDHIILRTAWVYSPYGRNFVKTMLRAAEIREELSVVNDQRGNPTSAMDLAAGILAIAAHRLRGSGASDAGIYHMTASDEATWADFADFIFTCSAASGGPVARVERVTSDQYPTPVRRPANSRLDCTKAAKTFGISLPEWHDSVRDCVNRLVECGEWNS
jgi:dTDP-4-dehydrorhamnose reductase